MKSRIKIEAVVSDFKFRGQDVNMTIQVMKMINDIGKKVILVMINISYSGK